MSSLKLFKAVTKNNKLNRYLNLVAQICLYALINMSLYASNAMIMNIAVVMSIFYCIIADLENTFSLIAGISIYEGAFVLADRSFAFVLLAIFIFKFLITNKGVVASKFYLFAALLSVIALEFVADFGVVSYFEFAITLVYVFFAGYIMCNVDKLHVDVYNVLTSFCMSFTICVVFVFSTYGGVGAYIDSFIGRSWAYRFALDLARETGGAMAMPLYAIAIISISIAILLTRKMSVSKTAFLIFAVAFSTAIGFLTVSRSFLLGLGVIALVAVLASLKYTKKHIDKTVLIFALIIAVISIVMMCFPELVSKVADNFFNRIDGDAGGGGRLEIWMACLDCLISSPVHLIFGYGSIFYPSLGAGNGSLDMAAGAHNLIIDILMSWGIVGLIAAAVLLFGVLVLLRRYHNANKLVYYIPLAGYAAFAMTALRTTGLRTWVFLVLCIVAIKSLSEGKNRDS